MDTSLREIVQIIDNNKQFIMFVFNNGVRELYDITGHQDITDLNEIKSLGKLTGRDYNGNNPNPPPIPTDISQNNTCQMCGAKKYEIENQKLYLDAKETELIKREKELDKELELIRKN